MNSILDQKRPANILLVEDNHGDVLLTKRAFKEASIKNQFTIASSGEEALSILHSATTLPDLILLDLNLPGISGHDVLGAIKQSERLKHIPTIILSSSRAQGDVVKSYNLHTNAYVAKPSAPEDFSDTVHKIEQFWFALSIAPELPA